MRLSDPIMFMNAYASSVLHEPITFDHRASPIFHPKKHTVESYRSQQRRAKKRKA